MDRVKKIVALLAKECPRPNLELDFKNPLELLVATIVAAQCTDVRVNKVTETLFKKYRTAADYAKANPKKFEQEIRTTGFFRSKTKSVIGCCQALVERHGGKVPDKLEDLVRLPGVGRKTANVVLGNAFGQQAIAVDTHVARVSARLGLVQEGLTPDEIEQALCQLIPKSKWTLTTSRLVLHGRYVCTAKKPKCPECPLNKVCPWPEKTV